MSVECRKESRLLLALRKFIADWTVRFEFSNRYMNIIFRFVWLIMFCKIFNMSILGYVITAMVAVILFIYVSWMVDRLGLVHATQKAIWQRTPEFHDIMQKLEDIEKK